MASSDDIILWPDGTSCYGDELSDALRAGGGFKVLKPGDPEYADTLAEMNPQEDDKPGTMSEESRA